MIRFGLLLVATALLGGCGSESQEPPAISGPAAALGISPEDVHCRAVARQRATDALANGYGFEIEDSVYQETYRDCMDWRTHELP
jgi:hypothetical protein